MTSQLVIAAEHFAREAHRHQRRKFYDAPYAVHLERCANRAAQLRMPPHAVAAMWDHDSMEDQGVTYDQLAEATDDSVAMLVWCLTNPSKRHSDWSRADKKRLDREHVARQSTLVRTLKLIDRIDNLKDIVDHRDQVPVAFIGRYVAESRQLLEAIGERWEAVVAGAGNPSSERVIVGGVGGTHPQLEREMKRVLGTLDRIVAERVRNPTEIAGKLSQETPA